MNGKSEITRRGFVKSAGAACALGSVPLAFSEEKAPSEKAVPAAPLVPTPTLVAASERAKIGCVSWCFHGFKSGEDPTEAINTIGDMGFEGTELVLLAREDIKSFWTDKKIGDLRSRLEKHKIALTQFAIFEPVVEGLSSLDAEERKKNLDFFEAGCVIGKKLGATRINIVAPWARELTGPGGYLPRYFDLSNPRPGEKFHVGIAKGFDWERVWRVYVDTTQACLERVKKLELKLSVEPHPHCLLSDSSSFLRLWDVIRDPDLGYNLDTGWTLLQREYPPLAIHKVKAHLMNVHMRDIDAQMRSFVFLGEGVMDFKAIVDTLKMASYRGYLSIEQDKYQGDMRAVCKRYLEMIRGYLA